MTELADLRAAFAGRLLTGGDMAGYLTDWRGRYTGAALAVVVPDTTLDVAAVVRWCAANAVPVVPQGGNTGLSGGATPDASGRTVVLSLTRLNRIRAIDAVDNTITVEAGCTLAAVQTAAADAGRLFPLSLAAQGSATIGGNLATNAGGTAVLRYGNARSLCLGLEVVTAAGEVWEGLRSLRKDNSGYDLRDLFIGAEGTLGVITAAVLRLYPLPAARLVAWVAVAEPSAAVALLDRAQTRFGPQLTAFELISAACLDLVLAHFPDARAPLGAPSPWSVLLELSVLDDGAAAGSALETFLGGAAADGVVEDAVIATSLTQAAALWALRENISEAQARAGANIKHDIAVPISRIAAFIADGQAAVYGVLPAAKLVVFGHLGDGNLHFNVSAQDPRDPGLLAAREAVNTVIHELVMRNGGSISAEHGLGVLRRDEAARFKSPVEMALMHAVKAALDPAGIMNPGKVLAAPAIAGGATAVPTRASPRR